MNFNRETNAATGHIQNVNGEYSRYLIYIFLKK